MKKIISIVLTLLLLTAFPITVSCENNADNDISNFETILLSKGNIMLKQFTDLSEVKASVFAKTSKVIFQKATVINLQTNETYSALRIENYRDKSTSPDDTCVIDADEIENIIATLQYVKQNRSNFIDYTEIIYETRNRAEIGAATIDLGIGIIPMISISFNKSTAALFDWDSIDSIISAFELAATSLAT